MVRFRSEILLPVLSFPLLVACGPRQLKAPSAPQKELSADIDLPTDEPPQGSGRIILDANGQTAEVVEITSAATGYAGNTRATFIASRPVCTTPCVVDLSYGTHPLLFRSVTDETRASIAHVDVGPRLQVVRHELGELHGPTAVGWGGMALTTLGTVAAVAGGILWATGGLSSSGDGHTSSLQDAAPAVTLAGVGALAIGIPLMLLGSPTERPGATTRWTIRSPDEPSGRPATQTGGTNL